MGRANVFVLASVRETFGVVLIEALAAGLPVIATRAGGPDEIVTDAVGWLVPTNDEAAMSEALRSARCEWASFDPQALAGYANERYGRRSVVRQLEALYDAARVNA
jgi:glycosyltransferase involved in cell wall biosynthesis